ncbi:hypothetical protein [Streptomyces cylindrosporus]|uniref:Uncharacterized protein n=1 Tax=Streptomyces cylindrosporus TaxID=2927583 RepID=A0ABS9YKQ5_9ACTN|nr:hypothetical protein [Streptomyces cylindrosporus]MCI3277484.1 hypothetical protein [Streptomyces cylindrosporus]
MARRIKAASVERLLIDQGHKFSEFEGGEWDPGFRVAQGGTRYVFVFYDGPGEAEQLEAITTELRAAGYHVVATQQDRSGRRRLEVTRP